MELKVRKFTREDIDACAEILMDAFSREPWKEEYESTDQVRAYFERSMENNFFLGYVGCLEEQRIAFCVGMRRVWMQGIEYYIDSFCVAPQWQGGGMGSRFLREIETRLPDEKLSGMLLCTDSTYPSCRFYEKNGFAQIDHMAVLVKA